MRIRAMAIASTCAVSVILTGATPGAAFANDSTTTVAEVTAALSKFGATGNTLVAPGVPSMTDANSAAQTTTVDVPTDPTQDIKLSDGKGPVITIGLPNAARSGKGKKITAGAVVYSGKNGSANAVIPTTNGVQLLTVIETRKAPTKYDYTLGLPAGVTIQVAANSGAVVVDKANSLLGVIPAPWAKDANGKAVKTRFTTDGKTLTQHVEHKVSGIAYPVTADPYYWRWWGVEVQLNRSQTNNVMFGAGLAVGASFGIPDATISKIVGATLAVFTAYANWVYNRGGCLAVGVNWARQASIWHYYGGNCR